MARPNAGDDSNPHSGEGGPRKTPAQLASDPAFTGTFARSSGEKFRRAAVKAYRRNSIALGVMATPPTLSAGTSNLDATLTKSWRTSVDGWGTFRFTGGTATQGAAGFAPFVLMPVTHMPSGSGGNTSGDSTTNTLQWSVEFYSDAPKVMLRYLNNSGYMVEVDDQPISAVPLIPAGGGTAYTLLDFTVGSATITASGGVLTTPTAHGLQVDDQVVLGTITTTTGVTAATPYFVKTTPSSTTFTLAASPGGTALSLTGDGSTTAVSKAAIRKYRFETQTASGFDGVYVGGLFSVWAPSDEGNIRVAIVGDSVEGSTGSTLPNGAWSKIAGKLLGWTDVRQIAFGGTGFVNAGTYNTFGAALRISDTVAANPDVLIIPASQNDDGQAGLQAATLATLQAYRTALPNIPIIVMGADPGSSGPSGTRLAVEAAALAAFNQWADSRSWYIPVSAASDGPWFTGTGYATAKAGSGNRDRLGADASHPNQPGHVERARRFEEAFRRLVLPTIY